MFGMMMWKNPCRHGVKIQNEILGEFRK